MAYRELDDALGLTEMVGEFFRDSRTGKNGWHGMTGLFRQSVFGRLGGYEDVNDADRLGRDPAMRWVVGSKAIERQAASTSQMGRSETELLARDDNLEEAGDRLFTFLRYPPEQWRSLRTTVNVYVDPSNGWTGSSRAGSRPNAPCPTRRPQTCCSVRGRGQGAPSEREMTIGRGFPSPYQPDKGRIATYRAGLGPDLWWYALCAVIVGNRAKSSGESPFTMIPVCCRCVNNVLQI